MQCDQLTTVSFAGDGAAARLFADQYPDIKVVILNPTDTDQHVLLLPAALERIEESAFEGNPAMHVVYVPDTCTAIGANAFKDCTGLTQIRLPKNCTIDGTAFSGCTGLIAIYAPAGGTTETWANGSGIPFAAESGG